MEMNSSIIWLKERETVKEEFRGKGSV